MPPKSSNISENIYIDRIKVTSLPTIDIECECSEPLPYSSATISGTIEGSIDVKFAQPNNARRRKGLPLRRGIVNSSWWIFYKIGKTIVDGK